MLILNLKPATHLELVGDSLGAKKEGKPWNAPKTPFVFFLEVLLLASIREIKVACLDLC